MHVLRKHVIVDGLFMVTWKICSRYSGTHGVYVLLLFSGVCLVRKSVVYWS